MNPEDPQSARQAISELHGLAQKVEEVADLDSLRPVFYRMKAVAGQHPGNAEIQSLAVSLKQRIAERGAILKSQPPVSVAPEPETTPVQSPLSTEVSREEDTDGWVASSRDSDLDTRTGASQPTISKQEETSATGATPPPPSANRRLRMWVAIAAASFAVVIFAIVFLVSRETSSQGILVEFRTSPPGASLRIDHELRGTSNSSVKLQPGQHSVEVILEGYEPAISAITVSKESPRIISLALTLRPQTIRIFTDFQAGEILLDGEHEADLRDSQLVLEAVPMGEHSIEVVSGRNRASFTVELSPGQAPRLLSPIDARNVLAILVSSAGGKATAYSNTTPIHFTLDGRPAGTIGAEGLALEGVEPGDHELQVETGPTARKLVTTFGISPVLTAFLKLNLNAGTLVVVTGKDDVAVVLNGNKQERFTSDGKLRIPLLRVGEYRVTVSKDGYETPVEQIVQIRKGQETPVHFELCPLAKLASLQIQGAMPDTEVLIDGQSRGGVPAEGVFFTSGISPGEHTIELRKLEYLPVKFARSFEAGKTVRLAGDELALKRAPGTLRLLLSPSNASVIYRSADEQRTQALRGSTVTVPEGSYIFTASAPGHPSKSVTVHVFAGETHEVNLQLARRERSGPVSPGMEGWKDPDAWITKGAWQVRTGGGFVPFEVSPVSGTFVFTARIVRGKRLRWAINYLDDKNYLLFEIGTKHYYRKQVTNGKTQELLKKEHKLKKPQHYTLSIDIAPESITHRLFVDGNWVDIDTWEAPGAGFTKSKFGLLIEDNRQFGLSNFSFTPQR